MTRKKTIPGAREAVVAAKGDWLIELILLWGLEFEDFIKDDMEHGLRVDHASILAQRIRESVAEREGAGFVVSDAEALAELRAKIEADGGMKPGDFVPASSSPTEPVRAGEARSLGAGFGSLAGEVVTPADPAPTPPDAAATRPARKLREHRRKAK